MYNQTNHTFKNPCLFGINKISNDYIDIIRIKNMIYLVSNIILY